MDVSVIIPLLNEEESLPELFEKIKTVMTEHKYSYEVIFVNDGSTDRSWDVIEDLQKKNKEVRGIKFRRNYGKSPALFHGFERAQGNVVITMDGDLQDNPNEIPALYDMVFNQGFDLVSGWKKKRHDSTLAKNIPSKIYNATARRITGLKLHDMNCGLKAYKNEVVKHIEVYGEMHRYIPYLAKNAGFTNITEKVVEHQKRKYGTSKFGLSRFVNGYLDLISLWFLSRFGRKPMHFFGLMGSLIFLLGFLATVAVGGIKLYAIMNELKAPLITDNPYFYLALLAMIMGTQLFLTGFLGELVSRNSSERNNYTIEKEI